MAKKKLSMEDVRAIRDKVSRGICQAALARRYGVSQALISRIKTGDRRLSAGGPLSDSRPKEILNPETVREIRRLSSEGVPKQKLAEQYGVKKPTIYAVVYGTAWRHVS